MKKFVTLLLALVLVLGMPVSAMAKEAEAVEKEEVKAELVEEAKTEEAEEAKEMSEEVKEEKAEEKAEDMEEVKEETEEKMEEKAEEAKEAKKAMLSKDKFQLNDEEMYVTTFKVEDENYFKIRDLAAILEATDKKFKVEFDQEKQAVIITKGEDYEKMDTDLAKPEKEEAMAYEGLHKLYIKDGEEMKEVEIKSYNILGNNYYRLRDLGKELGFGAAYDFTKALVMLDTRVTELEDIKAELEEKAEEMKEAVEEKKEAAEEKAEEVKEAVEEKAEEVKEAAEEKVEEVKGDK